MPAVSKAQFRAMFELKKRGKITQKELDDFTRGVDYGRLPDRVAEKRTGKGKKG